MLRVNTFRTSPREFVRIRPQRLTPSKSKASTTPSPR